MLLKSSQLSFSFSFNSPRNFPTIKSFSFLFLQAKLNLLLNFLDKRLLSVTSLLSTPDFKVSCLDPSLDGLIVGKITDDRASNLALVIIRFFWCFLALELGSVRTFPWWEVLIGVLFASVFKKMLALILATRPGCLKFSSLLLSLWTSVIRL